MWWWVSKCTQRHLNLITLLSGINKMLHILTDIITSTNSTQNTNLHLYPVHTLVDSAPFDIQPLPSPWHGPTLATPEFFCQSPAAHSHCFAVEFYSTKWTHSYFNMSLLKWEYTAVHRLPTITLVTYSKDSHGVNTQSMKPHIFKCITHDLVCLHDSFQLLTAKGWLEWPHDKLLTLWTCTCKSKLLTLWCAPKSQTPWRS